MVKQCCSPKIKTSKYFFYLLSPVFNLFKKFPFEPDSEGPEKWDMDQEKTCRIRHTGTGNELLKVGTGTGKVFWAVNPDPNLKIVLQSKC